MLRACVTFILFACVAAVAQSPTVSGRVKVKHQAAGRDNANVVVWLLPLDQQPMPPDSHGMKFTLTQKNKRFEPHLLVVHTGTVIESPNRDPFFHNVFSLYDGKRFDLGLYEAGTSRSVQFTRAGVSYVFCNIHPEMSAVVVSVNTPFYATTGADGAFSFAGVPAGRYQLKIWYERALPESLASLTREVTVGQRSHDVGEITLTEAASLPTTHKNKYGREYDNAPSPYGPVH